MATLSIRNLPDDVHARLRVRAALHGRSMESEARDILATACLSPSGPASDPAALQSLVDQLYDDGKPTGVVDRFIAERRREAERE
ncbi:MAG TPA: Arc family DNA-binding protein [Azospirillum sp.]